MMAEFKVFNGVRIELTADELAEKRIKDSAGELEHARKQASLAREAKYAADTAAGFTDGDYTYSLAAESLKNWESMATTLSLAIDSSRSGTTAETKREIFTAANAIVEMKAGEIVELLAAIGEYAMDLKVRDYKWQGAIAAATTVQQLAAIQAAIKSA